MWTKVWATTATVLLLSTVALLKGQAFAIARSESVHLAPGQAQSLSRDLVHLNSQDFFNQGQYQFEREIQSLSQKKHQTTPLLKIDANPVNEGTSPRVR